MSERHHITVLFADLSNFTALGEAWDPEFLAELKTQLEYCAEETIVRHGGVLNQTYGDGVLALFGYPEAREDDSRRAVYAALELHERVRALRISEPLPVGFELRMHSGIHSGIAHVTSGGTHQGRYGITGDVVNTAARLGGAAPADVVLVSETCLGGSASFFEVAEPLALALKGKQTLLRAVPIVGRSKVESRFEARALGGLAPFVGRDFELHLLDEKADAAARGQFELVALIGDAGVGKSRILRQFEGTLAQGGARVLRGTCEPIGDVMPFQPFVGVLRQVFGLDSSATANDAQVAMGQRVEEISPELARHLPMLMRALSFAHPDVEAVSPEDVHLGIVRALVALLTEFSRHAPLGLLLDDWQWADDASELALRRVADALRGRQVMVVVCARQWEPQLPEGVSLTKMKLYPLSSEESRALVESLLPDTVGLGFCQRVHAHCGGNALFIEEVCRSLRHGDAASSRLVDEHIPSSVREVIQARLQRLTDQERRLIRLAAVAGQEFFVHQLTDDEVESVSGLLERLVAADLIHPSPQRVEGAGIAFRFKHGIAREVAYESILLRDRRVFHAASAQRIERRYGEDLAPHYETLAHHYAGSENHERAAHFAEQAAMKAVATNSLGSAQRQYRSVLDALDAQDHVERSPTTRRRWLRAARAWAATCVFSPSTEQLDVLGTALEHATRLGSEDDLAHVHYWLGWLHYALGDQGKAVEHDNIALRLARALGNMRLVAQLELNLGQSHAAACQYVDAREHLVRGLQLKGTLERGTKGRKVPVGFAYALGYQALIHGDLGEFDEAYANLQLALTAVADTAHAIEGSVWTQLGMIQLWQGKWREASETAKRMRATAERVNGPYIYTMSQVIRGYALAIESRDVVAVEQLRQAADWLESTQMRLNLSWAYALTADAMAYAGQANAARAYAERALDRSRTEDRLGEIMARRALGRAHAERPEWRREELELARQRAQEIHSRRELAITRLELMQVHREVGESVPEDGVDALVAEFQAMGMPWYEERTRELRIVS